MTKFFLRWFINAVALYAAVALLANNGVTPQSPNWLAFIWLALIFGLVNALIKPIVNLFALPLHILTLGLFTLVVNAAMFALAGWIGTNFGVGFTVDGFWPALLGGLIVSVVSMVLGLIFKDELKGRKKRR